MAKDSLSDDAHAFNPHFPLSNNFPQNLSDLADQIENDLAKAKSLVIVALWGEGLNSCSVNIQHDYLSVLDDLLEKISKGFICLRKMKSDA